MRQVLGPGALGRPRGMGWGGRQEGGSGWGTHVNPWLIHVNVWQKPLQYCKVISLQLIKMKKKIVFMHFTISLNRNEMMEVNCLPFILGAVGVLTGLSHNPGFLLTFCRFIHCNLI